MCEGVYICRTGCLLVNLLTIIIEYTVSSLHSANGLDFIVKNSFAVQPRINLVIS